MSERIERDEDEVVRSGPCEANRSIVVRGPTNSQQPLATRPAKLEACPIVGVDYGLLRLVMTGR